ncbi:MAG: DNA recombination protein RmuC [Acutalibacteraceae bacterium]|nr:DNA recombination protein RmuC [Acutalibacteraceae bacterium]HIR04283.1 DNA recombination protein RmuC [Candidatus Scatovicinus merdipullorum]
MELYLLVCAAVSGVLSVVLLAVLLVRQARRKNSALPQTLVQELQHSNSLLRQELLSVTQNSVINLGDMLSENLRTSGEHQTQRLTQLESRFRTFSLENAQKLEMIRDSVEKRLAYIQEDNTRQLEKMRTTVDEKLQKTLEEKMNRSFAIVGERLEQVYKGLGEMQNLASGVGDLKKVLSNVKTRGILGEIQLEAILKEILAPQQYEKNVVTKKGSKNYVEFAVRLPAQDDGVIYLPVDSKFPGDVYAALVSAYEQGSKEAVQEAAKVLLATLKAEARDIRDKYIDPPNTTEFAIMFLPFEGLYAEAVNRGLVEVLQREYKVNIAGPSTMAALLNSIQMGFKTLAVQKRSAEAFRILEEVKTEFDKFAQGLLLTQQRLDQANSELDRLVGVRTRQIQKRLAGLSVFDDKENPALQE